SVADLGRRRARVPAARPGRRTIGALVRPKTRGAAARAREGIARGGAGRAMPEMKVRPGAASARGRPPDDLAAADAIPRPDLQRVELHVAVDRVRAVRMADLDVVSATTAAGVPVI